MTVDIGTGDGAFVLRRAKREPGLLHVGIDSSSGGLREASRRAARKPARGGVPNTLFVRAQAESLPEELAGLTASVTVLMPWGSLLSAVAHGDARVLAGLRRLCAEGATLRAIAGDPIEARALPAWREAGFDARIAIARPEEIRALGTTWASRLVFGRPRTFYELTARAV